MLALIPSSKASLHDTELPNQDQAFTEPTSTTCLLSSDVAAFPKTAQSFCISCPNNWSPVPVRCTSHSPSATQHYLTLPYSTPCSHCSTLSGAYSGTAHFPPCEQSYPTPMNLHQKGQAAALAFPNGSVPHIQVLGGRENPEQPGLVAEKNKQAES